MDHADAYVSWRSGSYALDAESAGVDPLDHGAGLWGVVFEVGLADGAAATLLALADGTTTLAASSGGLIAGGGAVPAVVAANQALLAAVRVRLDVLDPTPLAAPEPPAVDETTVVALLDIGRRSGRVHFTDAVSGGHPLSLVFARGHELIAALGTAADGSPAPH